MTFAGSDQVADWSVGQARVDRPELDVVIVAWRAAPLAIDCLRSIEPELAWVRCRVFVVDNDSQDGSAESIEQAIADNDWSGWASVLRSPVNGGFAAGNNHALRALARSGAVAPYALMLNPDTVVRPRAFRILLDFMDAHPQVGIAGGRSEDQDTTPQLCCFSFPSMLREVSLHLNLGLFDRLLASRLQRVPIPDAARQVGWVSGALMIVRQEVFRTIGLMDESYFLYYEETDFTLRAQRAGWPCWHVPESRIVHLVGQSTGVGLRHGRPGRRPAYWFESRRRYFVLNHGRLYAAMTDVLVIVAHLIWRVRRAIQRKEDCDPPHFLRDFIRYSAILNGKLAPRRIDP